MPTIEELNAMAMLSSGCLFDELSTSGARREVVGLAIGAARNDHLASMATDLDLIRLELGNLR